MKRLLTAILMAGVALGLHAQTANLNANLVTGAIQDTQGNPRISVATVAALRALPVSSSVSYATGYPVFVLGYYTAGDGGGGQFVYNATSTATDNGGTIIKPTSATTGRWLRQYGLSVDARGFGVIADGTKGSLGGTDNTTALQACSTFSMATGTNIQLPPGVMNITGTLDLGKSVAAAFGVAPSFKGAGRGVSVIQEMTSNTVALQFGSSFGVFTDCDVAYETQQAVGNTGAVAFQFWGAQWFNIERVGVYNAQTGFAVYQGAVIGSANYIFNGTIADIYISVFTGSAMNISGYSGGCGGMSIRNVWAISRDISNNPIQTLTPFIIGAGGDMTLQNINVQNLKCPEGIYVFSGQGIKVSGLHIEACTFTQDYGGVIHVTGQPAVFENLAIQTNSFLVGNAAHVVLFRVDTGGSLIVNGGTESGATVTSTTYYFNTTDSTSKLFTNGFTTTGFTSLTGDSNPVVQVKQIAENWRTISFGTASNKWVNGPTSPVSGTWTTGDVCYNQTPSASGVAAWICTSGGTPGTWTAMPMPPALAGISSVTAPASTDLTLNAGSSNQSVNLAPTGTGNVWSTNNHIGPSTGTTVINGAGYSPSGAYPTLRAVVIDSTNNYNASPLAGIGFSGARNNGTYDWPFAAIYGGKENGTASNQQGFLDFFVTSSSTSGIKAVHINSTGSLDFLNQFTKYNNVSTAGLGVPAIYGSGRSTAQTAAVASVAAYTVGAADGSFAITANVLVTTATNHAFTVTCTYTDEGNTSRTVTLTFGLVAGGVTTTSIANANGAVPYMGVPLRIRAKAGTTITIATTGTFTTVTYNVEASIIQLS